MMRDGNGNGISWECQYHEEAVSAQNYGPIFVACALSARSELHSHPLAEQAQACGRLTKADGPEGPMAPVETTDAATVDQRCSFKHQTRWRHNHSNSKLCVALRMGQANLLSITNCHLCAGAMLSSFNDSIYSSHPWIEATRSIFQANSICACHPCASHTSVPFKKKTTHLRSGNSSW